MSDFWWKLTHTRVWSRKRRIERLRWITADQYEPMYWRRLASRPGWFIAFVRFEPRDGK